VVFAALGAFDFDVHGVRAGFAGGIQNLQLLLDAAGEAPLVLTAAAGGQNRTVGRACQELSKDRDSF